MKYSQGQWKSRGNKVFIGDSYKGVCTVDVQKNYEDITFKPIEDVEQIANSKLICAAPEMLEVLKKLEKHLDLGMRGGDASSSDFDIWKLCSDTIKKAID